MSHVHYKFSSKLSYNTVVHDGPNITLKDLKRQIMDREKLRAGFCDLQITNAQTKQEYTDDEGAIPKGSSVIVRRIPIVGAKSGMNSKTRNIERSDVQPLRHVHGANRAMADQSSSKETLFFSQMANLADADVSEEDKIKVMMNQSSYDSMNYNSKFGNPLPVNYTCYRCGNTGHHIRNCPNSKDKNVDTPVRIKKSTGIPRSFMVEVDDPSMKGAMLTNSGRYAIPAIDAEAYAIGKKEKPAFLLDGQPKAVDEEDPVPDELLCLICRDLLSDAVVIPCCGNSYCDDCIRTALLDSEEHICPTCSKSDVSPDNLIANKFLRQAINTFNKERGNTKTLSKGCGTSQSNNPTPTPSPAPSPPPLFSQIQPPKPLKLIQSQQDPLLHCLEAVDTPPLSQESEALPSATGPTSASNTPDRSPQTVQIQQEITDLIRKAEEETQDDSEAAAAPSELVSETAAPSELIPLVDHTQAVDESQPESVNQQKSSSGSWSESNLQHLPPPSSSSSSSYPPTPPPLFASPHFPTFQPLSGYPSGYPPAAPVWTFPALTRAPIPSLCSTTSSSPIPALIPNDWYMYQRNRKERSPHRGSVYRHSSKSSKSKSSHSYPSSRSRSRSRSRSKGSSRSPHRGSAYRRSSKSSRSKSSHSYPSSRSRSRSKGRSRPHSSSSRHRDHRTHSHSSRSYSYGYKRSHTPTTSSSSSPRAGNPPRHESPSHHHHHRKKSATSSSRSRSGGTHHSEEGGSAGSLAGYMCPHNADQASSPELDRQRYLQWKREYKEWCEKYLNSYLEHFHQLPPLPPFPPPPPGGEREKSRNNKRANKRDQHQGRCASRTHCPSPPSQSSSDSCSISSQSSSDSSSKSSHASSDTGSSPSDSTNAIRSPSSRNSSDSRSTQSEDGAQQRCEEKCSRLPDTRKKESEEVEIKEKKNVEQLKVKNLENLSNLKQEGRRGEESLMDDGKKDNKSQSVCNDGSSIEEEATGSKALESAKQHMKPDKYLDKDYERDSREQRNIDVEKGWRRDKCSDSRILRDGTKNKEKSSKRKHGMDIYGYRHPLASDSISEKNRKRKGEDMERRSEKAQSSSKWLKTKTTEVPEPLQGESQYPFERTMQKPEKKYEKKAQSLTVKDIWEDGIKVKPQKKISINIKLDAKVNVDKTETQATSYSKEQTEQTGAREEEIGIRGEMETNTDQNKESSRDQEEQKVKIEGETRQMWAKNTFKDETVEMSEKISEDKTDVRGKKEDREFEELDKWECEEEGEEEESKNLWVDKDRMKASDREEVMNDEERSARGGKEKERGGRSDCRGQEMGEVFLSAKKEGAKGEITGKENRATLLEKTEPKEKEIEGTTKEGDVSVSKSQRSRSESNQERANTTVDDNSSSEGCQERKGLLKTLEEYTDERPADGEDEQVPRSKWEKEESKDEVSLPSSSVSVTAEATAIQETGREIERQRQTATEVVGEKVKERGRGGDGEKNSHRSVAPSSGRDRHDNTTCSGRDKVGERESERRREKHKESIRSKVRTREEDKGRDRERERSNYRNAPPLSHSYSSSTTHDSGRREKHHEGDQSRKKSSSFPGGNFFSGRSFESSTISHAFKLPDENVHKRDRNTSLDWKCKDKDRPSYSWDRDQPSSKSSEGSEISKPRPCSPGREVMHSSRNESKVEKKEWKENKMNKVTKERKENQRCYSREKEVVDGGMRRKSGQMDSADRKKLEDGERPSSRSSNSSSSSQESCRDNRRVGEDAQK